MFDRIVAPAKELLVFEVDRHLLFNECVQLVTDPLVDHIRRLAAMPGTAQGGDVMAHRELHRSGRAGWLRAAVLGANDGIVSTASLVIGVAAAAASRNTVLLAGVAGLVAGATSMAAGEYVSVSPSVTPSRPTSVGSGGLAADPELEQAELTDVYVRRGWTGRWPPRWPGG